MTGTLDPLDVRQVEQFLYREARLADEHDYNGWESLWTDGLYWVPANGDDTDRMTPAQVLCGGDQAGRPFRGREWAVSVECVKLVDEQLFAAPTLDRIGWILRPVVWLLMTSADGVVLGRWCCPVAGHGPAREGRGSERGGAT